jgi:hypothetical protein
VSEEFQQLFGRLGLINTVAVPIAFDFRDLIIDVGCWKVLGTVDFDAFQANLCEADWSENRMPAGSLRWSFAFLVTQEDLRLIHFVKVELDDPTDFLRYMSQVDNAILLSRSDPSSRHLTPTLSSDVLGSLRSQPHLRHVEIPRSSGGNECARGLADVVAALSGLNKIIADGLACERLEDPRAFCSAIVRNPNMVTCDLPKADLWQLGISIAGCSTKGMETLDKLRKKAKASTIEQKVEFTREYFRKEGDFLHTAKDIYLRTSEIAARAVIQMSASKNCSIWI